MTPGGCAENLALFDLPATDLEATVCSHGHFDHITGSPACSECWAGPTFDLKAPHAA